MSRRTLSRVFLAATFAAGFCCGGCYQHVVSAKGYGADRMQVTPANVPSEGGKISGYKKIEHRRLPE